MAANLGSQSEIIWFGSPNLLNKLSQRGFDIPSQVIVFAQGHKITPLLRPWNHNRLWVVDR